MRPVVSPALEAIVAVKVYHEVLALVHTAVLRVFAAPHLFVIRPTMAPVREAGDAVVGLGRVNNWRWSGLRCEGPVFTASLGHHAVGALLALREDNIECRPAGGGPTNVVRLRILHMSAAGVPAPLEGGLRGAAQVGARRRSRSRRLRELPFRIAVDLLALGPSHRPVADALQAVEGQSRGRRCGGDHSAALAVLVAAEILFLLRPALLNLRRVGVAVEHRDRQGHGHLTFPRRWRRRRAALVFVLAAVGLLGYGPACRPLGKAFGAVMLPRGGGGRRQRGRRFAALLLMQAAPRGLADSPRGHGPRCAVEWFFVVLALARLLHPWGGGRVSVGGVSVGVFATALVGVAAPLLLVDAPALPPIFRTRLAVVGLGGRRRDAAAARVGAAPLLLIVGPAPLPGSVPAVAVVASGPGPREASGPQQQGREEEAQDNEGAQAAHAVLVQLRGGTDRDILQAVAAACARHVLHLRLPGASLCANVAPSDAFGGVGHLRAHGRSR
mmetsp:Transcript_39140/g.101183  ORF Transcript_39140/g.101183 Transcript_39140/m.101183 type:complete len:499 (+) Transcript_39140:182-1678(+)